MLGFPQMYDVKRTLFFSFVVPRILLSHWTYIDQSAILLYEDSLIDVAFLSVVFLAPDWKWLTYIGLIVPLVMRKKFKQSQSFAQTVHSKALER